MTPQEIRVIDFPIEVRPLAEFLGVEKALRLAKRWERKDFYVPFRLRDGHPIGQEIGPVLAATLCQEFGGCFFRFGNVSTIYRNARDREIVAQRYDGVEELSKRYGLSQRRIWFIISRYRHAVICANRLAKR